MRLPVAEGGLLGIGSTLLMRLVRTAMAVMFFVQAFRQKGRKLEPQPPEKVRSPEAAITKAERVAPSVAGVWAYSQDIDVETDTYDDPKVLFKTGVLPTGLAD
jgi:hypothetical protein